MTAHLLGLDVGTSGAKALLVAEDGAVVASATIEYPLDTPRPLWAEQNPADWWAASAGAIRRVIEGSGVAAGDVAAVGLTGQMHGLVLLDAAGDVLRPCILWNDQRTGTECDEITRAVGASRVLELTGNPVLAGFTAPKIAWVRKHEPDALARTARALLPKDYVRWQLTGEFLSDVSDASGTSLFDVGQRAWSAEMLKAVGVPRAWLPEVTESPVASARVSAAAARETGLAEGTPVAAGAGDQAAQAVGTGIVEEGVASVTIGTSGVVFAHSDAYRAEPEGRLHAFCHAVPGAWHLMGATLSAGGSLRWYRDALCESEKARAASEGSEAYDLMLEDAASAPAGCEGLFFLPYLTGERTPHADPDARGAFVGLTLRHGKAHLTRAVIEGVSYALRDSLELMRALGLEPREVRASGGGAKSAFWRQILADVFGQAISTVSSTEGAAFGAALLAGVSAGVYSSVKDACARTIRVTESTAPDAEASSAYADYYPRFRALYPALAKEFKAITKVVEKRL